MPDLLSNKEGPLAKEPTKFLNRRSYGERLAKEAFSSPATRGLGKDSDGALTPAVEAARVPAQWALLGPCKPTSCTTFLLNTYWGRAATGKEKVLRLCMQGCFGRLQLCDPVDCGLPGSLSGGFSR